MTTVNKIFAIIMVLVATAAILIFSWELLNNTVGESIYVLRESDNTVTLYCDDTVVESYNDIAVETLPVSDRKRLQSGIEFKTADEARRAVEDYDG